MSKHRTRGTGWNRLVSGVLCLALVLGLLPTAGLVQTAEAASWADPYGEQLVEWGIMNPSSNLRLGDTITRAEFVTMCNRAFGYSKLGGTPFVDVPSSAWYAQDIDIAYNAGYFMGTTSDPARPTASPNANLTREQAAVLVARNLMLRETVGESLGFTDSRELNEWSRGLIGAAVAEGMITGYSDGSYRPFNNITRGEVAAMLVRIIGTPVNKEGSHELGNVYGNVTISSSNVTLRNTVIVGNLYITGGVDLGNVLLENVTVLGRIVISGGESAASQSSVILRNVEADELVVDSMIDQFVTISAYGVTSIPNTYVRSDAYLEDASSPGYGLYHIELDGRNGTKLQLAGSIKEVVNKTPFSELQLVKGTAEKITIDEYARGSHLLLDTNTRADELNLDVATLVTGEGDIKDLNIGADGCEVDILPDNVVIRPGITATVDGQIMGSVAASELSAEPRLLAGYPNVVNIAPTQAEGLFSANKPGTIYWAVSELASGSVSDDDLISNPAYGGNIFSKQAGSISASSRTEFGRQIVNLVPDGSYYLSAILVDGRGNRSPSKTIAFTTPDDTVPAFVTGYPRMSKITCTVAQVTAMANKNCLMYYALLAEGAAEPTPQQFKSGSVGGNYGYGSADMVKNAPISITVNRNRLQEKTQYVLYLWLTDYDGAQSSSVVALHFTTPDETPPVVSAPRQTDFFADKAEVTFNINEAPSTLFWAVVAEGNGSFISLSGSAEEDDELLRDLRTKIKVESGAGSITHGSTAAAGAGVDTLIRYITGLEFSKTNTNNFIMYYIAKDAAGNYSEKVGYIRIRTLDTIPPTVTLEFTKTVDDKPEGQPLADTDIRLVFSEQVKGGSKQSSESDGNTPVTFLDFYNRVLGYPEGSAEWIQAKNDLAKELDAHIKLYYVPATGAAYPLTPKANQDVNDVNWVIDWHNAVITMGSEGEVIITLPSDGTYKALQLDSGATYYFQFLDVFDNAYNPNGLEGNRLGNWKLNNFTTAYAQVDFWQNTGVLRIDNNNSGDTETVIGTRLDIVVDISPRSTEKVPLSEYWELIMWGDNVMTVDIYREVVEKDNESNVIENWHKVRSNVIFTYAGSGKGLKENEPNDSFEPVQTGLSQQYVYRYGVHIKEIAGTREDDPAGIEEPKSWSALATMRFSLIAGNSGDVADVSRLVNTRTNVDTNYNSFLRRGAIKEIGTWNSPEDGMVSILRGSHQFRDSRAPSFVDIYPQFTAGSASVKMEVMLDRPGTLYYVVAPVKGGLGTSADGTTLIGVNNDGRGLKESDWSSPSTLVGYFGGRKTYIPTGGNDITAATREYIHFITGGDTVEEKMYVSPDYLNQIYNEGEALPVELGNKHKEITIPNLRPETEYYIYIVLEGGGDPSPVMQIYRFDTTKAEAPSVTVSGTGSVATMTPSDDCLMYFVLVQYSALDAMFKESRTIAGQTGNTTWLDMMSTLSDSSSTTGHSLFDTTANPAQKSQVAQYILSRTDSSISRWELPKDADDEHPFPNGYVPGNEGVIWDFNKDMDVEKGTYVVLVMVKQVYAGSSGDDYGFGAFYGLHKRDDAPPSLVVASGMKEGIVLLSLTDKQKEEGDRTGEYTGSLDLLFDKNIYFYTGKDRYTLTYADETTDSTKKNVVSHLGGGAALAGGIVGQSPTLKRDITNEIYLTITNITRGNGMITFFADGVISNADDYPAGTLVLTFDPKIPAYEIYTDAVETSSENTTLYYPGFRVTWS